MTVNAAIRTELNEFAELWANFPEHAGFYLDLGDERILQSRVLRNSPKRGVLLDSYGR
jgi:hypothetical protein